MSAVTPTGVPRVTKNSIEYTFSCTDPTVDSIIFVCEDKTARTPASATSVLFTGLEYGATYTLKAIPITADGQELPPTIFPAVTTCEQPQPPENVLFSSTDNSTLQLSWTPVPSLATDAPKWYVLSSTDNIIHLTIEGWRTSFVSPPMPGGTFRFYLYAVNDAGYSTPVTSPQAYNFI